MASTWDATYKNSPAGSDAPSTLDNQQRALREDVETRMENEHYTFEDSTLGSSLKDWRHKQGSAKVYYQGTTPTNQPGKNGATLGADDAGRLFIDSANGGLEVWNGTKFIAAAGAALGFSNVTLTNYDSDSAPEVTAESTFECSGDLIKVKSAATPTGYSGITNSTTFYLYWDYSASGFIYSATAPTWSDSKKGWYNGDDRALFSMYKDSGGTLYQLKQELGKQKISGDTIEDLTINNSITFNTVTTFTTKTLGSHASWVIPVGFYMVVVAHSTLQFQMYDGSSGWFGTATASGLFYGDGVNYRVYNADTSTHNAYYRKIC